MSSARISFLLHAAGTDIHGAAIVVLNAECRRAAFGARPRHALITAASFIALVYSGIAILLAHPRLYWGETGALGTPSLIDLPLPMVLTGQTGWGRYLHFLSATLRLMHRILSVARRRS
jgi:hypothetical protein